MSKATYNIVTFGKLKDNLSLALQSRIIGSPLATFEQHVEKDNIIFLHCRSVIWGSARVSSKYFYDENQIWPDKIYPHRFEIDDILLLYDPIVLSNGDYNVRLKERYGTGWAYKFIFSPKPLPDDIATDIHEEVRVSDKAKDLLEFQEALEVF